MMVYSAINVPYSALMGVISADSQERTSVSSYRFAFAFGAGLVVQFATLYLVDYFGRVRPEMGRILLAVAKAHGYQITMAIYAVAAVALFFLTFALTRERVQPIQEKSTLRQDLKDLASNVPWLILFAMGTLTVCSVAIRSGAILYYFQYYVGNEKLSAAFMVAGTVMSLRGLSWFNTSRDLPEGKPRTSAGVLLATVFLALSYWVRPDQVALMFVFQVLYSAGDWADIRGAVGHVRRLRRLLRVAHRPPGHRAGLLSGRHVKQTRLGHRRAGGGLAACAIWISGQRGPDTSCAAWHSAPVHFRSRCCLRA